MRLAGLAVVLLSAGALQACATPEPPAYGPISETAPYGYKDRPNPDGGHTVLVVMPAWSSVADARTFWDRRAEELCPGGVAKRNVFRAERKEYLGGAPYVYRGTGISQRTAVGYEIEGYVYCRDARPAA